MMPSNVSWSWSWSSHGVSSDGVWQGENPIKYAFPLLVVQITLVLLVSRTLALLLKPFRQPKVVAEIVGGILLGPSALGRSKSFLHAVFPSWSSPIRETVSGVGLLFYLFLVGLELDIHSLRRSGRRALGIAVAGVLLPFVSSVGIVFLFRRSISGARDVGFYQFLVFIGVALSITAFPVLARILAELKLLTTAVGETAMAAAAFNDMAAWVLLALAVAMTSGGQHKTPLVSLWILLSGFFFVVFMMTVVRRVMGWIARLSSSGSQAVGDACVCLTLAGVLLAGLMTDFIGIHSIFGAFVFGLMIPKDGTFARKLSERIEVFVSELLLPLYFASSGLNTDVATIHGAEAWGMLALVIITASVGKVVGTFAVGVSFKMPAREAATLGVLMGTKGLVELIVLNIGREKKVLNDETFTILVLMALFTTFVTTPVVIAIYRPALGLRLQSDPSSTNHSTKCGSQELRILACVQSPASVTSIVSLIETIRGGAKRPLKLYVMQLVELTERPSSIFTVLRARKNGRPSCEMEAYSHTGRVMAAFDEYEKLARIKVRPLTAISAMASMHEDICHVADDKRVALLILPFHKRGVGDVEMEDAGVAWSEINQLVLAHAPCSVGVLVDRGFGGPSITARPDGRARRVCVLFFGGPDDREALEIGRMMMDNPGISLTVIRSVEAEEKDGHGLIDDEEAIAQFQRGEGGAVYEEKRTGDAVECTFDVGRSGEFELVMVGKRHSSALAAAAVAKLGDWWGEIAELGPIGNILASQGRGVVSSVLVIQRLRTERTHQLRRSAIRNGDTRAANTCPDISTSV